jgi:hypothetical protein
VTAQPASDAAVRRRTICPSRHRRGVSNKSSCGTFELPQAAGFEFETSGRDQLENQNDELAPEQGFEP